MKSFIILIACLSAILAAPLSQLSDNGIDQYDEILHIAAEKGDHLAVKKSIDSGASVNSTTNDGGTPLHKAAERNREKVAQVLLDNGANVNSQDLTGLTPLHRSALKGHENMIKFLIDKNAKVNLAANDGSTPLHVAFDKANMKVTKTLIRNGADMTIRNNNGESVIDLSLNHITKGVSTILFGIQEVFHRTLNTLRNPMDAIKKSHLKSVNLGPHIKVSFGDRPHKDNHDDPGNENTDISNYRITRPSLRLNFSR